MEADGEKSVQLDASFPGKDKSDLLALEPIRPRELQPVRIVKGRTGQATPSKIASIVNRIDERRIAEIGEDKANFETAELRRTGPQRRMVASSWGP